MGCGCDKNIPKITTEAQKEIPEFDFNFIKNARENNPNMDEGDIKAYLGRYIERNVKTIVQILNDITPFLSVVSEQDLLCLECCEKHLAKAHGYIDESAISDYRNNVFFAVGQLGLAENHARAHEETQEAIRAARLDLQRNGTVPDWSSLLDMLDKCKESAKLDK